MLDWRLCDLGLELEKTIIQDRIAQVRRELEDRGLRFDPHFWLSTEWFSPDGVPGVAIPFYLAHPRLAKLEERQMLEVEGGKRNWCLRLLRHELGHAIDNAYRLRRRQQWRALFGKSSTPYPAYYSPKPFSRNYVLHLDYWYAQSHPCEDFAETFAVWLAPGSQWRRRYRDWPAIRKLEYVHELMGQLAGQKPPVRSRQRVEEIGKVKTTLREYYEEKRERYGTEYPEFYDRDLRRLFSQDGDGELASRFLRRIRNETRQMVAAWTGEYQYPIDLVLREMIDRCRQLNLRLNKPPEQARQEATILLTVQTMNFLHSGRHRIAV